jgi:hypothetical protein
LAVKQTMHLQRWEEARQDEGRLEAAQLGRHVPGHPEVGVLPAWHQRRLAAKMVSDMQQAPPQAHGSTWSMAQGMRQRMFLRAPNMCGKEVGKQGAACTAGKAILPMQSSCVKPKMPRTWFTVTALHGKASLAEMRLWLGVLRAGDECRRTAAGG